MTRKQQPWGRKLTQKEMEEHFPFMSKTTPSLIDFFSQPADLFDNIYFVEGIVFLKIYFITFLIIQILNILLIEVNG